MSQNEILIGEKFSKSNLYSRSGDAMAEFAPLDFLPLVLAHFTTKWCFSDSKQKVTAQIEFDTERTNKIKQPINWPVSKWSQQKLGKIVYSGKPHYSGISITWL